MLWGQGVNKRGAADGVNRQFLGVTCKKSELNGEFNKILMSQDHSFVNFTFTKRRNRFGLRINLFRYN